MSESCGEGGAIEFVVPADENKRFIKLPGMTGDEVGDGAGMTEVRIATSQKFGAVVDDGDMPAALAGEAAEGLSAMTGAENDDRLAERLRFEQHGGFAAADRAEGVGTLLVQGIGLEHRQPGLEGGECLGNDEGFKLPPPMVPSTR